MQCIYYFSISFQVKHWHRRAYKTFVYGGHFSRVSEA